METKPQCRIEPNAWYLRTLAKRDWGIPLLQLPFWVVTQEKLLRLFFFFSVLEVSGDSRKKKKDSSRRCHVEGGVRWRVLGESLVGLFFHHAELGWVWIVSVQYPFFVNLDYTIMDQFRPNLAWQWKSPKVLVLLLIYSENKFVFF